MAVISITFQSLLLPYTAKPEANAARLLLQASSQCPTRRRSIQLRLATTRPLDISNIRVEKGVIETLVIWFAASLRARMLMW